MLKDYAPSLFSDLKKYSIKRFFQDLLAGITVGIVALPIGIAFGIASGLTPAQGILSCIIPSIVVGLLGGSKSQISGATGAFIVISGRIISKFGFGGLVTATILAGLIMVVIGFAKVGASVRYISSTIIMGVTTGIACIIFTSYFSYMVGMSNLGKIPIEFLEKWAFYFQNITNHNIYSMLIVVVTIVVIVVIRKLTKRIPGALFALIASGLAVRFLGWNVETIGSKFGEISLNFKDLYYPDLSFETIKYILPSAITIAILCSMESLISNVVTDSMSKYKSNTNSELIAQGIANIITPFFGGLPTSGAIARSTTSVQSNSQSSLAAIFHSITLILIVYFGGELVSYIPMACLAGIIALIAYDMINFPKLKFMIRIYSKFEIFLFLLTFLLTILVDLVAAIQIGLVLSAFAFMHQMYNAFSIKVNNKEDMKTEYDIDIPENVGIIEPAGALFFGASGRFYNVLIDMEEKYEYIVFDMYKIHMIDASGMKVLTSFVEHVNSSRTKLLFINVSRKCEFYMKKAEFGNILNDEYLYKNIWEVLEVIS